VIFPPANRFIICFAGKYHDLESSSGAVIRDAPDNGVDDEQVESEQTLTTQVASVSSTTSMPQEGFKPYFTNLNALNRINLRPSGNMVKLKCPAKGDPEPTWEWTKNGKPIERKLGEAKAQNKKQTVITLEDLIPADSGQYTCNICNIHGCINFTSKLEVNGKSCLLSVHPFIFKGQSA
jgi:hypothetical protein